MVIDYKKKYLKYKLKYNKVKVEGGMSPLRQQAEMNGARSNFLREKALAKNTCESYDWRIVNGMMSKLEVMTRKMECSMNTLAEKEAILDDKTRKLDSIIENIACSMNTFAEKEALLDDKISELKSMLAVEKTCPDVERDI